MLRCHVVLDVGEGALKLFDCFLGTRCRLGTSPSLDNFGPCTTKLLHSQDDCLLQKGWLKAHRSWRNGKPAYDSAVASWSRGSRGAHNCKSSKGLAKSYDITAEESKVIAGCFTCHNFTGHFGSVDAQQHKSPAKPSRGGSERARTPGLHRPFTGCEARLNECQFIGHIT